jgi:hypothetical protein
MRFEESFAAIHREQTRLTNGLPLIFTLMLVFIIFGF